MTANESEVSRHVPEQELLVGELTAALVAESMTAQDALPPALAAWAIAAGEQIVPIKPSAAVPDVSVAPDVVAVRPRRMLVAWSGWLAAAALLTLWLRGPSDRVSTPTGAPAGAGSLVAGSVVAGSVAAGSVAASAAASWVRDSLIAVDPAITRIVWAPTKDATALGAGGDVVWSTRAQRGVMRLIGLKSNDTRRWQYQLWIFDKARDQRYPVDGGVFDVPAGATEVFVPINARLPVGDAVMFAVTVEVPGGVVVSTRERVALLAAL